MQIIAYISPLRTLAVDRALGTANVGLGAVNICLGHRNCADQCRNLSAFI